MDEDGEDTAFPPSLSWLPFPPLPFGINWHDRCLSLFSVVNVTRVPLSVLSSLSCIPILIECSFLQKGNVCSPSPSLRYFILPLRFIMVLWVTPFYVCVLLPSHRSVHRHQALYPRCEMPVNSHLRTKRNERERYQQLFFSFESTGSCLFPNDDRWGINVWTLSSLIQLPDEISPYSHLSVGERGENESFWRVIVTISLSSQDEEDEIPSFHPSLDEGKRRDAVCLCVFVSAVVSTHSILLILLFLSHPSLGKRSGSPTRLKRGG